MPRLCARTDTKAKLNLLPLQLPKRRKYEHELINRRVCCTWCGWRGAEKSYYKQTYTNSAQLN